MLRVMSIGLKFIFFRSRVCGSRFKVEGLELRIYGLTAEGCG